MERIVNLHIEKLPEGVYLATSDDVQGLIAQGRTDVAKKLIAAQTGEAANVQLPPAREAFDYPLIVNA